ncbi:hypothetical protein TKK_0016443 [Trichogramma kaykai]
MEGMKLCESEEGNVTEMEQDEELDITQRQRILTELKAVLTRSRRERNRAYNNSRLSYEDRNKIIEAQSLIMEKTKLDLLAHEKRLREETTLIKELVELETISVEEIRYDYFMTNKCMQAMQMDTESRKRPIMNDESIQDNSEEKRRRLL